MFELHIVRQYLFPSNNRFALSALSWIAVFVIACVVWLILTFFSVTEGLEEQWIHKLSDLTGTVRVSPTQAYYASNYFQVDSYSMDSDYTWKTLEEKILAQHTNPHDPSLDPPLPDFSVETSKDLAKQAHALIASHLGAQDTLSFYQLAPLTLELDTQAGQRLEASVVLLSDTNASLQDVSSVPMVLPKTFLETTTVRAGDRGNILLPTLTLSGQDQIAMPAHVAGFYDPGLLAIGAKFVLVPQDILSHIRSSWPADMWVQSEGFKIELARPTQALRVQEALTQHFAQEGLGDFFRIESFYDYPFTKAFLQDLQSQRNLFTLLACIIVLVALSNTISLLIILVNDKKYEIAIFRSMGASSMSIACIFGLSGFTLGTLGSLLGTVFAYFTLQAIPTILRFMAHYQGFDPFAKMFSPEFLPTVLHPTLTCIVIVGTSFLSLFAALIPGIFAAQQKPSQLLKS